MKKGDKVRKFQPYNTLFQTENGGVVTENDVIGGYIKGFQTIGEATAYQKENYVGTTIEEAKGSFWIKIGTDCKVIYTGIIDWVVEDEACITIVNGSQDAMRPRFIINTVKDTEWLVIEEAAPTFQSSVDQMSIEDLQKSITGLREQRANFTPRTATRKVKAVDPLEAALAKMSPEEVAKLRVKLGM
jgi:hypothetical protein